MPNQRNQDIVKDMQERLKKVSSAVLFDFTGIPMTAQQSVRRKLRKSQVDFVVIKNTLLNISAKQAGVADLPTAVLKGQTGVAIGYDDPITVPKLALEISKEFPLFKFKGGFLPDTYMTAAQVEILAKTPGKDQLRAQVVGLLAAPMRNLVSVLSGNARNLVSVLNNYQQKLAS